MDIDDVQTKLLGFCGCGDAKVNLNYIRNILAIIDKFYSDKLSTEEYLKEIVLHFNNNAGAEYFMFYWLDKEGYTEHGGSVPGWLTDEGHKLLQVLNEILADD